MKRNSIFKKKINVRFILSNLSICFFPAISLVNKWSFVQFPLFFRNSIQRYMSSFHVRFHRCLNLPVLPQTSNVMQHKTSGRNHLKVTLLTSLCFMEEMRVPIPIPLLCMRGRKHSPLLTPLSARPARQTTQRETQLSCN